MSGATCGPAARLAPRRVSVSRGAAAALPKPSGLCARVSGQGGGQGRSPWAGPLRRVPCLCRRRRPAPLSPNRRGIRTGEAPAPRPRDGALQTLRCTSPGKGAPGAPCGRYSASRTSTGRPGRPAGREAAVRTGPGVRGCRLPTSCRWTRSSPGTRCSSGPLAAPGRLRSRLRRAPERACARAAAPRRPLETA